VERRAELTAILVKLSDAKADHRPAARPDSQAAGVAFVLGALGWRATEADVGQWLNIGTVLFLELAAALSLTVAAGLYPSTRAYVGVLAVLRSDGARTRLSNIHSIGELLCQIADESPAKVAARSFSPALVHAGAVNHHSVAAFTIDWRLC
jgi:hypothetical protein